MSPTGSRNARKPGIRRERRWLSIIFTNPDTAALSIAILVQFISDNLTLSAMRYENFEKTHIIPAILIANLLALPYNYKNMRVVSIVGMAGSGKSEVARIFERKGFKRIRFGDITDQEVKKRNLPLSEENERRVRELLRKEHGMAAYAKLNLPAIDAALKHSDVVIDGLYSWEEFTFLKSHYGKGFYLAAVYASPKTRHARLAKRLNRPLTEEEAASRDKSEIENVNKGGPIAIADFTIINESSLENLRKETERVITTIK